MKWAIVLVAALALGAAACGGGNRGAPRSETNPPAVATATPTVDPTELAPWFQQLIASQRTLHQMAENDRLSLDDSVTFEKAQGLILDLCSATWEIGDRDWRAVFDAACSELGPVMLNFAPERYDGAIQILMNAINNGP